MSRRNDKETKNLYYEAGCSARTWGNAKVPPGALTWRDRHWWLAGWNDRDMELVK